MQGQPTSPGRGPQDGKKIPGTKTPTYTGYSSWKNVINKGVSSGSRKVWGLGSNGKERKGCEESQRWAQPKKEKYSRPPTAKDELVKIALDLGISLGSTTSWEKSGNPSPGITRNMSGLGKRGTVRMVFETSTASSKHPLYLHAALETISSRRGILWLEKKKAAGKGEKLIPERRSLKDR